MPAASATYNLITGGVPVVGTPSLITTDLSAYGPTRVTGTTSIVGDNLVFTVATGPANLIWNNAAGNGAWNLNTSTNFNNNGTNDVFQAYDSVTFDDSVTPGTVTLSGNLAASVVTVNNSTGNYTFGGSGGIVGPVSLVKSGTASLIVTAANTYTGGTTVNGGMIVMGKDTALGSGAVILNGGNVERDNPGSTIANNVALAPAAAPWSAGPAPRTTTSLSAANSPAPVRCASPAWSS